MESCCTPRSNVFILSFVLLATIVLIPSNFAATPSETTPVYNEQEVKDRLAGLEENLIECRFNPTVSSYIRAYLRGRRGSEYILGRTVMYFPIFETHLEEAGLPEQLKYLPIIESSLNPKAVSRVGAVGLWQFMPATARELGLKIGRYVDERVDPYKATDAAMRYLSREYDRFGDWALVLAAYNSGSGRVGRAIKRARSKDYWRLQRYLPRETRNYVPRFIAATYLVEFYDQHELRPNYPSLDLQLTETLEIFEHCSFFRIAQVTGLTLEDIEALNPSYTQGFIPANTDGNFVTLPKRVMPQFKEYISSQRPDNLDDLALLNIPVVIAQPVDVNAAYEQSVYVVREGQTLQEIAKELHCTAYQLRLWNNLSKEELKNGQELTVFQTKEAAAARKKAKTIKKVKEVAVLPAPVLGKTPLTQVAPQKQSILREEYVYYTVKRRTKLSVLAKELGLDHDQLLQLNGWIIDKILKAGEQVKLKKVALD